MARKKLVTSRDIRKLRVVGGKKGTKRIGKVKSCVFHPTERRCIGFIVKRPDLLWMFHRKDIFVALDGFDFVDGRIRIKPDAPTSGHAICRAMGLDWDKCVLWEGLPIMTADETAVGFVSNITFDIETGQVEAVEASNGATAKLLLGTLEVPASCIAGFKHGMGADLAVKEDSREAGEKVVFKGAILVSDDVWELSPEGGWAEAAGKFTAKAGARARETAAAAKEAADAAKPKVEAATAAAGAAVKEGAEGVGRQVSATKDAFGAFKEEFNKAAAGEETEVGEEVAERESKTKGMFAAFKEEFDKAKAGDEDSEEEYDEEVDDEGEALAEAADDEGEYEEPDDDEYEDDEYEDDDEHDDEDEDADEEPSRKDPGIGGMFAAFKSEFDKAAKGE